MPIIISPRKPLGKYWIVKIPFERIDKVDNRSFHIDDCSFSLDDVVDQTVDQAEYKEYLLEKRRKLKGIVS